MYRLCVNQLPDSKRIAEELHSDILFSLHPETRPSRLPCLQGPFDNAPCQIPDFYPALLCHMLVFTAFSLILQNIAVLSTVKINRFTDTKLKTGKVAVQNRSVVRTKWRFVFLLL